MTDENVQNLTVAELLAQLDAHHAAGRLGWLKWRLAHWAHDAAYALAKFTLWIGRRRA